MVTLPKPFLIMRKRKIPRKGTVTPGGGKRRISGGSEGTGEETTTPQGRNSNAGMFVYSREGGHEWEYR